jgi:hypothetical protein
MSVLSLSLRPRGLWVIDDSKGCEWNCGNNYMNERGPHQQTIGVAQVEMSACLSQIMIHHSQFP